MLTISTQHNVHKHSDAREDNTVPEGNAVQSLVSLFMKYHPVLAREAASLPGPAIKNCAAWPSPLLKKVEKAPADPPKRFSAADSAISRS